MIAETTSGKNSTFLCLSFDDLSSVFGEIYKLILYTSIGTNTDQTRNCAGCSCRVTLCPLSFFFFHHFSPDYIVQFPSPFLTHEFCQSTMQGTLTCIFAPSVIIVPALSGLAYPQFIFILIQPQVQCLWLVTCGCDLDIFSGDSRM
jgi:hypothetical protein